MRTPVAGSWVSRQGAENASGRSRQGAKDANERSRQGAENANGRSRQGAKDANGRSRQGAKDANGRSRQGAKDANGRSRQGAKDAKNTFLSARAPWREITVGTLGVVLLAAACAPKAPSLPTGPGTPFPDFASAYSAATASCGGVRSYTAVMALSGKAGRTKLRGRIEAGFEAPGRMRLEGIAPFGRPVFVLTASGAQGTLVLPREDQVLEGVAAEEIVNALAGVPLGADALRTAVTGCGLEGAAAPAEGRSYPDGRAAIVFADGTAYLRSSGGAWILTDATRGGVLVSYADVANGRPATVRIRVEHDGTVTTDLALRLSEVEINTTIDPRAFTPELPAHPIAITLDELRRAGPLGESGS